MKDVLPALVHALTYEGMAVANGQDAGLAWESLVRGTMDLWIKMGAKGVGGRCWITAGRTRSRWSDSYITCAFTHERKGVGFRSTMAGRRECSMHCNDAVIRIAEAEIPDQVLRLPRQFTSADFLTGLAQHAPREYETIVRLYTVRGYDRPHAKQIAHREITHTLRNGFADLVVKVGDCPNPKGGTMGVWNRI